MYWLKPCTNVLLCLEVSKQLSDLLAWPSNGFIQQGSYIACGTHPLWYKPLRQQLGYGSYELFILNSSSVPAVSPYNYYMDLIRWPK